ncbi:VanZ family protein [Tautonia rosea]|uniref:VanZ family protein n=1 Tax=Tautonia rosea TaxID=2728037 RepID=UPI001473E774|nr:VanZ family protein [Tautonia rosea]
MAGRGSRPLGVSWYAVLAVGLLVLTVYGSIIPLRFQPMPYEEAIARYRAATQFDPTLLFARGDWVVNGFQYALLSFCLTAALSVDLRAIFRLVAVVVVIPIGFLLASWLEFLQVYFPPRTVSVNDLIVEGTGIVAGALAWLTFGQPLTNWLRRFWEMKGLAGLARQALPLYVAVVLVFSLIPFDFVVDTDELVAKARQGRIALTPFGHLLSGGTKAWVGLLIHLATFVPLGALAAWVSRSWFLRWTWVLTLGLVSTVVIEVLQLFVYTRYCDVTDILTGTAAVMIGWWVALSIRDRQAAIRLGGTGLHDAWEVLHTTILKGHRLSWTAAVLGVLWVGLLIAVSWQPFTFSTDPEQFRQSDADLSDENTRVFGLRRMNWAPFIDYYWNSRYGALDQILSRSLSFAPIGVVFALAFGRKARWGMATTLIVAVLVGGIIEVGQYFIPERHPGTTDLLIQVFGACLGFALARHIIKALGPDQEAVGEARYHYGAVGARPSRVSSGSPFRKFVPRREGAGPIAAGWQRLTHQAPEGLSRVAIAFDRWFEPLSYPLKVIIISATAALLTVGLVVIAERLGLI